MQDRYAGDVGDFGKFSLLRYLFDEPSDRIGVIWYLFPNESHNGDGGHIAYLENEKFLNCDRELCTKLSAVVHGDRCVMALEKAGLLPTNTVYFSQRLDFHLNFPSSTHKDRHKREECRKDWFAEALSTISNCNIAFLDPDNGLQIPSCSKISQIKSGKFTYYSEVSELSANKEITVIYHHLGRRGTHIDQISAKIGELRQHINPTATIFALRYKPYSPRAYFIVVAASQDSRVRKRLLSFRESGYTKHWDSYHEERPSNESLNRTREQWFPSKTNAHGRAG
jgi:hypothetical protein